LTAVDDNEPFLSRWSRRKLEAKEPPPGALPAADFPADLPAAGQPAGAPAVPPLSAIEPAATATPQDTSAEYREFFDPRVDEKLRQAALRKLFDDPHFNVMDGLDTYVDDYSKPDPIPQAMLRQLNQAKELFLFDDEKNTAQSAGDEAPRASGETAAAPPVEAANATTLPDQAACASAQDTQDTIAATGSATAPPAERVRND
jgi:hypothetical protein